MKKEDLQNLQQQQGSTKNKDETRDQQKNQTTNISNQRTNLQADLGRDRMIDMENSDGPGADDYAGNDRDNQNTNQPIDS
jgi:hypothetical protein